MNSKMKLSLRFVFSAVIGGLLVQAALFGCTQRPETTVQKAAPDKVQVMQEAIVKSPSYENYITLGLELANVGRGQEALNAYRKASEINPKAPLAWNNLCAEFNKQGKFVEAKDNCEKAIALEPKFELAQNNLKFSEDKIAEIKKSLVGKKSAFLAKANVTAQELINYGMQFYSVADFDTSVEFWHKVKKGDPLYAMAQNNLASSYIQMKKYASAEQAINEALKLEPQNELFSNNKKWLEEKKAAK